MRAGVSTRRTKPQPDPATRLPISAGYTAWTAERARDRYKIHDPPMGGAEMAAIRALVGGEAEMSQEVFGELLGRLTRRSISRYERGTKAIPPLVAREARRLRMIAEGRLSPAYVTTPPESNRRR